MCVAGEGGGGRRWAGGRRREGGQGRCCWEEAAGSWRWEAPSSWPDILPADMLPRRPCRRPVYFRRIWSKITCSHTVPCIKHTHSLPHGPPPQALSVSNRKPLSGGGAKAGAADGLAGLLQLPHFDGDTVKKLKKKRVTTLKGEQQQACVLPACVSFPKYDSCHFFLCPAPANLRLSRNCCVRRCAPPTPAELQDVAPAELPETLKAAGLEDAGVEAVTTFLATLPAVHVRAECEVGGVGAVAVGGGREGRERAWVWRGAEVEADWVGVGGGGAGLKL